MARRRGMKAGARTALAKLNVTVSWRYGRDLTDAARRGQLDPVIGREQELGRLIQILGRKTKNNPVLLGRSGVGKTAIVEGLALRIAEGDVPPGLQGKRVVSLDLATMLAGARIRGEFEERLKSALALLAASQGEFLLLIVDTLSKALGILFLIFLSRLLLRKQWLAAGMVVVVLAAMYAPNEANPFIGWPVNIVFFGLMVFILMQFGLLAVAVALFVAVFVNQFPLNTDWSVWYAGEAAFTVLFTVALALFGFRTALAGQPLFRTE